MPETRVSTMPIFRCKKSSRFLKGATSAVLTSAVLVMASLVGCGENTGQNASNTADEAGKTAAESTGTGAAATNTANDQKSTPQNPRAQPPGIPPLIASPQNVDFGIVEPGSKLSADVTLLNTSEKPIRILRAQPSCTCTTVSMDNVIVPARGTVQMPISMTTNRAVGKKVARVQLLVEGYPKFFTVNLDAENAWAVRAIPPHISLKERTDQLETLSGQFMLESVDKRKFNVLNVMEGKPDFIDFDPETDEPRNRYVLRYDFNGMQCSDLPKFLIVRTDHPGARMLDVRVRHDPCTKIQKTMPMNDFRSNLGVLKPGQKITMDLGFKKPKRPTMSSVTSNDPNLKVRMIDQKSEGKELLVTSLVEISPDMPDGLFQVPIIFSDGVNTDEHLVYGWIQR